MFQFTAGGTGKGKGFYCTVKSRSTKGEETGTKNEGPESKINSEFCGKTGNVASNRVMGGSKADIADYPFMAIVDGSKIYKIET